MNSRLIFIFILSAVGLHAQIAPASMNQASFYSNGGELVVNKAAWKPTEVIIQYKSDRAEVLEVTLNSYSTYKSKNPNTSKLIKAVCENTSCNFMVDMSDFIPGDIYLIVFKDIEIESYYFIELDAANEVLTPVLVTNAFEDIVLDRNLLTGTEIYPKALNNNTKVYIYYYADSFKPADSPIGISKVPSKGISYDQLSTIRSGDPFQLDKEGLYFLQTDTSTTTGYGLRVHNAPYPVYNSLDDLKNCMVYITILEEWKKLRQTEGKQIFDDIWMDAGGNENNAKSAIRNYFRNVAGANRLFTSYKEGWKTDKGMIYSVFGPPKTVTKMLAGESWSYDYSDESEPLVFTFINKPNIFSPYHSILSRKKEYAPNWHYTIDKLRQGIQLNE